MQLTESKQRFIQAWGTLGSNWGINRTMAQIHALLLASPEALSTDDLMEALSISRGNASMNIRTLVEWGIVFKEIRAGDRKEYYYADKDIDRMARQIARERKRREIEPVVNLLEELRKDKEVAQDPDFQKTVSDLHGFTSRLTNIADVFLGSGKNWLTNIIKKLT
ncbi:GbsR/MarR family transcriptional regulator [Roseivirga sp. BDSF3-8]|uniref:GbsR/MarR family transcriptional regulator n=1 Tax=Roseivirga sp. BDSF3-8 TaxID=3241598 RepID=UPI003531D90D